MAHLTPDARLEATLADYFWAEGAVSVHDRPSLGYVSSPTDSAVFNTVYRVRPALEEPRALVAEVRAAHAGRASQWSVTNLGSSPALEAALEEAGYRRRHSYRGYTLPTAGERISRAAAGLSARRVTTMGELRALDAVSAEVFGRAPLGEERMRADLATCTRPDARVIRYLVWDGERPIASAGLTLHPRVSLGFLWAGGVLSADRGRGAYRMLLSARLEYCQRAGMSHVGLYAREDTSAPIVAAMGFERHGFLRPWVRRA